MAQILTALTLLIFPLFNGELPDKTYRVTDLESHISMCEEWDINDRAECINDANETWKD